MPYVAPFRPANHTPCPVTGSCDPASTASEPGLDAEHQLGAERTYSDHEEETMLAVHASSNANVRGMSRSGVIMGKIPGQAFCGLT